jgi:hypothetical protein
MRDDSGQSVVEFLLVLPLLLTILMLIVRVNTVIQMSIVDQKYAREQVLFISGNSPDYPLRANIVTVLAKSGMNQLVVGVSENKPADADGGEGTDTTASTYYIGRKPGLAESQDSGDDITARATIRVRNTVTLCLPMISFGGTPAFDFNPSGGGQSKYNLPDDPRAWKFCSSKLEQST